MQTFLKATLFFFILTTAVYGLEVDNLFNDEMASNMIIIESYNLQQALNSEIHRETWREKWAALSPQERQELQAKIREEAA